MAVNTNEIWEEFSDHLKRFILSRVRDQDAAEDILQDAFLKIHQNIGKLKDENRLRAWLYQITRNTIIDYYRNREVATELPESLEDIAETPDPDSDVGCELVPCVKTLMGRLPDRYRQSLILTELQGLSQKEMGEKLGLSVSGAKSRAQRARQKLKDTLLRCCDFEFDRRGNILEYQPKGQNGCECPGDRGDGQ